MTDKVLESLFRQIQISNTDSLISKLINKNPTQFSHVFFYFDLLCLLTAGKKGTPYKYLAYEYGPFIENATEKLSDQNIDLTPIVVQLEYFLDHKLPDYRTNLGWKSAYENQAGSEINMVLAMQQLVDVDDDWLNNPILTQEEEKAFQEYTNEDIVTSVNTVQDLNGSKF